MCEWLDGLVFLGQSVLCRGQDLSSTLAFWVAAGVVLVSVAWIVLSARRKLECLGGAFVAGAALLLAVAAGLPALQSDVRDATTGRIVVLLDASESVRRDGGSELDIVRREVAEHLRVLAETQAEGSDWTGSVYAFGTRPRPLARDVGLLDLPPSVLGADLGHVSDNTNFAAAIDFALDDIAGGQGAGMIVLISDGLPNRGETLKAVRRAQQSGVPIHFAGIGSAAPSLGLLSADIGPNQALGRPATVRMTVLGDGVLDWGINGLQQPQVLVPDAVRPRAVHVPVEFLQRGLNFIDLAYRTGSQEGRRKLAYTLVRGPARILVYGRAPWIDVADPRRFLIERADPYDDISVQAYDAIVIDSLSPSDFASDMPQRLLDALVSTGLLIENGELRGTREEMQLLSDWEKTVLGPVLPVSSDSADYLAQPPKRDVMIIFDTSGSMGSYMNVARAAANRVLDSLRPQDSFIIVPFADNAAPPFSADQAGPDAVLRARDFLARLNVSGGTNMTAAINRARALKGNNCALFIIGDGNYPAGQIQGSPICFTTAIGVANLQLPGIDTSWGQQIPIHTASQLGRIEFEVFEPEPRTAYWADGPLMTVPVDDTSPFAFSPRVSGAALSYPRPEASGLVIMADPPRAPVLAFRQDPDVQSVRTGVFLGVVPFGLPAGPSGWASRVLGNLVGWDDLNHFDIAFGLDGEKIELSVTPTGDSPPPTAIAATLQLPDGQSVGISVGAPNPNGVFEGSGLVSLSAEPTRGILYLEVGGSEAQAIPVHLPSLSGSIAGRNTESEALAYGINWALLEEIANSTGGLNLLVARPVISRSLPVLQGTAIWPWLAGLAALAFAISLFMGGVRR